MSFLAELQRSRSQVAGMRGFTLIEVLVTIVIMLLGILGVIGMQARSTIMEFESYQRGEALSLVREMQVHLTHPRTIVTGYLDPTVSSTDGSVYVGSGEDAKDFSAGSVCVAGAAGAPLAQAQFEMCQWGQSLQGAAVVEDPSTTKVKVGAMIGARGCVIRVVPAENNALADLYVTVVWQGQTKGVEPDPKSAAGLCASGVDFGTGLRRGVSVRVLVPDLTKSS